MNAKVSAQRTRGASHVGNSPSSSSISARGGLFAMLVGSFALVGAGCGADDLQGQGFEAEEEGLLGEAQDALNPWPPNASLQLDVNFESGTYSPLSPEIHGGGTIAVIADNGTASNAPNSGSKAVKMTVSGADTYRAELKSSSQGKLDYDSEYWLGFAFRVESWGQADFGMLFQTHAVPSTWDNCTSGRNPVSITVTSDGRLGLNVINNPKSTTAAGGAGGVLVWSAANPVTLNAWQRWVIRLKPSATSGGVIQAWLNGDMIYERSGANVDALDTCGAAQDNWVYTKFGIYKSYSNTNTQKVVYDDIRILKGTGFPSAYNLVRPPGLPAK